MVLYVFVRKAANDCLTSMLACNSLLMTETMTSGLVITVLVTVEEAGGIITVIAQTSMGCTLMVELTVMVSSGTISMPLHQVIIHFAILT